MTTKVHYAMQQAGIEPGDVTWSARASKSGWLVCDGSAVSRTTYAALFAAIGTTFGVGDGSTTFNLPDGQGRSLVGVGTGSGLTARALADTGGEEAHALTEGELAAHRHLTIVNAESSDPSSGANVAVGEAPVYRNLSGNNHDYTLNGSTAEPDVGRTSEAGSGTAHNNMQPFLALNLFIYAGA